MKIACPKCGANIVFLPDKQYCYCDHCQSVIEPQKYYTKEYDVQSGDITWDECTCSSCGAKLLVDEFTIVSRCVYCGSNEIIKSRFQGDFKPDKIIPFEVTLKAFLNKYQRFIEHKQYVPYDFTQEYILNDIKGLYVPMYLYEYQIKIESDLYYEKEVYQIVFDDDKTKEDHWKRKSIKVQTNDYNRKRYFSCLLDGASKIQDSLMKELEPFDQRKLTDFHPMYLCGFIAQNGDETETWLSKKAKRVREKEMHQFLSTVLKEATSKKGKIKVRPILLSKKYYLYPVWFFNTTYHGEKYFFAVNGQSGKVVGKVPIDKKRFYVATAIKTFFIGFFLFGLYQILRVLYIVSVSAFSIFPILLLLYYIMKVLDYIDPHWLKHLVSNVIDKIKMLLPSKIEVEIEEIEKPDDTKKKEI